MGQPYNTNVVNPESETPVDTVPTPNKPAVQSQAVVTSAPAKQEYIRNKEEQGKRMQYYNDPNTNYAPTSKDPYEDYSTQATQKQFPKGSGP